MSQRKLGYANASRKACPMLWCAPAGGWYVAAIHGTANASLVTGYGYTGVLVAFIARANPLGAIPVAILFSESFYGRRWFAARKVP